MKRQKKKDKKQRTQADQNCRKKIFTYKAAAIARASNSFTAFNSFGKKTTTTIIPNKKNTFDESMF